MNFSPCSLGNVCKFFIIFTLSKGSDIGVEGSMMQGVSGGKTNTTCLVTPDPNRPTITLQMCGNGIVENGEDCDPGIGVESPCCDTQTCKFINGAFCDPASSPCCTQQCGFAPSTQVCRPSKDPTCDTTEVCTGNSSACPADVVAPNGWLLWCIAGTFFHQSSYRSKLWVRAGLCQWSMYINYQYASIHFLPHVLLIGGN
jgi:hypothetical protein